MAANDVSVDMRGPSPARAGTYVYEGDSLTTGWHSHDLHQLEYALEGVAEVETDRWRYLLSTAQAIWIPAGLAHNTTLNRVRSIAVFFDPEMITDCCDRARVLATSPLLREMMIYAARWSITRDTDDPVADVFFNALGHVIVEALDQASPLALPSSTDPLVRAAMEETRRHPELPLGAICVAIGTSPRTVRRHFSDFTDSTWQQYRLSSRLLKTMVLLSEPEVSVLRAASEVGFKSVNSFTRAFTRQIGETPSAYRKRVRKVR
jgi:AraC-like DNA-binding protein